MRVRTSPADYSEFLSLSSDTDSDPEDPTFCPSTPRITTSQPYCTRALDLTALCLARDTTMSDMAAARMLTMFGFDCDGTDVITAKKVSGARERLRTPTSDRTTFISGHAGTTTFKYSGTAVQIRVPLPYAGMRASSADDNEDCSRTRRLEKH